MITMRQHSCLPRTRLSAIITMLMIFLSSIETTNATTITAAAAATTTTTTIYGWQQQQEQKQVAFPLLHYDFSIESCRRANTLTSIVDYSSSSSAVSSKLDDVDYANKGTIKEGMGLIRNKNLAICSLGMGVEVNHPDLLGRIDKSTSTDINDTSLLLYSSHSIRQVKLALEETADNAAAVVTPSFNGVDTNPYDGVTFSMWINPLEKNDRQQLDGVSRPILTIGPRHSIPTNDNAVHNISQSGLSSLCDTNRFDMQLSYTDDYQLELIYRTTDRYFQNCQRILYDTTRLWNKTSIQHIAISMRNLRQEVFINGQSVARKREPYDNTLKHWNESSIFQFFHHPYSGVMNSQSLPWDGRLYQFSMYRGVWEESQVKQVMSEGLPPTQPYGLSDTVTILEDARKENGQLEQISLPFLFVDKEMDVLLTSLQISHQAPSKVRFYITRFPPKGKFWDTISRRAIEGLDGSVPTLINDVNTLVYIPVQNEHSTVTGATYTSFDFCVTTNRNAILATSQCESATLSIVVDPVNDPPVTIPLAGPYYVHEGIHEDRSALRLTGYDVDIDDSIAAIQITSPPTLGYLYLSVSTFRSQDSLLHGTLLSDINHTIPGGEAYVEYYFTGYSDRVIVEGSPIVDVFRFRVQDTKGSWSDEQGGEIYILPSVATATTDFPKDVVVTAYPVSEQGTPVPLRGVDTSGLNRTLGFVIGSIPGMGSLFDSTNTNNVAKDTIIYSDKLSITSDVIETNLTYVPSFMERCPDYYFYMNDSFWYRVAASDSSNEIVSVSKPVEQFVQVPCSIDHIELEVTVMNGTGVEALVTPLDHPCSSYSYNIGKESSNASSCFGSVIVSNFHLQVKQKFTQLVLVCIYCHHGLLTLNQQYLGGIYPLSDHQVMRRKIRFLTKLDSFNDVLSSLHYQSEVASEDQIHVVVEYGRCNHQVVHLLGHDFSETGPDCIKVEKVLNVIVRAEIRPPGEFLYREFPWIPLPFTLCILVFLKVRGKSREILLRDDDDCDAQTVDATIGIRWKQHYDIASGFYYYEDLDDGEVTWEPPLDERFIPSLEGDGRSSHQLGGKEDHPEKKTA
jgi:hypothetical protein